MLQSSIPRGRRVFVAPEKQFTRNATLGNTGEVMHTAWKVPYRRVCPVQRRRKRKASAGEICCNLQFREDDSYSWHRRSNSQGMQLWGIQEKLCTLHGRCHIGASVQYSGGGKGKRALERYAAIFNSERTTRIRGTVEAIHKECNSGEYRRSYAHCMEGAL
jgi:hypothetical protein